MTFPFGFIAGAIYRRCAVTGCDVVTQQQVCRSCRRVARAQRLAPSSVLAVDMRPEQPSALDAVRMHLAQQAKRDLAPQLLILDEAQAERPLSYDAIRMQLDMQAARRRSRR